jgi:hypothetical protein
VVTVSVAMEVGIAAIVFKYMSIAATATFFTDPPDSSLQNRAREELKADKFLYDHTIPVLSVMIIVSTM